MSSEMKENYDSQVSKNIAQKLRQRDNITVSPIDLSLEISKPLNTGQLQWINFYEPPLKLTMRNNGDTVMIQGRWPHQRPTLCGGPLDGHYVFSQMHFHWNSVCHEHNRHTINGKSQSLEMHALFYKSSYKTQKEAQEKEDGVLIVVYFFKIEKRSSFKWMTEQLEHVSPLKAKTTLPPAPLCALMVPFTRDYLVYWAALPCTCHHVLWMVSRTALRITTEELEQFGKLQSDLREKINIRDIETEKVAKYVYKINSSNDNHELLFPDSVDPPCQITSRPDKITIAIAYHPEKTSRKTANKALLDLEHNLGIHDENSLENIRFQEKGTSMSDLDLKNGFLVRETSDQHVCSSCKNPATRIDNRIRYKLPKKKYILASRKNVPVLEKEKITHGKKIKTEEEENSKNHTELSEFGKTENEWRLLEKEKEDIYYMRKALDDEMKRLAVIQEAKESEKELEDTKYMRKALDEFKGLAVTQESIESEKDSEDANYMKKAFDEFKRLAVTRESKELEKDREDTNYMRKVLDEFKRLAVTQESIEPEKEREDTNYMRKALDEFKRLAITQESKESEKDREDTNYMRKALDEFKRLAVTQESKESEKEREDTNYMRKALDEFKRLAVTQESKESEKEREDTNCMIQALDEFKKLAVTQEVKELSLNDNNLDVNNCLKRLKSPNHKSLFTSKPNSAYDQNKLGSEKENKETSSQSISHERDEFAVNPQSEIIGDQRTIKEEENKNKKVHPSKSRLPVKKFTPWKPEGLQSSLTPYFRSSKSKKEKEPEKEPGKEPEKEPDVQTNSKKITSQIPKLNKKINRTVNPRQDIGEKGDHPVRNPKRIPQKPMGHLVSFNYL